MRFPDPLLKGRLIKRYKRFLADVELEDGRMVTAHCANPGTMISVNDPDAEVWLSPARNPERKLKFTWELIRVGRSLVGINTMWPNAIVSEAIAESKIPELMGYDSLRREVKYGKNSRIDILLESEGRPNCFVEIKSVTMRRDRAAEFPDAVTARGTKHLGELAREAKAGNRAVMVYLVQRGDCQRFWIADDIDPTYHAALGQAIDSGVEVLVYRCRVTTKDIKVAGGLSLG